MTTGTGPLDTGPLFFKASPPTVRQSPRPRDARPAAADAAGHADGVCDTTAYCTRHPSASDDDESHSIRYWMFHPGPGQSECASLASPHFSSMKVVQYSSLDGCSTQTISRQVMSSQSPRPTNHRYGYEKVCKHTQSYINGACHTISPTS